MSDRTRKIKGYGERMGNTGGYKPFSPHAKGAGHSGQPSGKSVGYGTERKYRGKTGLTSPDTVVSGKGRQHGYQQKDPPANVEDGRKHQGHEQNHSELTYKGNHGGKGYGVAGLKGHDEGSSFRGRLGPADSFRGAGGGMEKAHGFRHEGGLRNKALRMSGDPRAHQVGKRGK